MKIVKVSRDGTHVLVDRPLVVVEHDQQIRAGLAGVVQALEGQAAGEGTVGLVLEHGDKTAALQLVNVLRIPIIGTRYELVAPDTLENLIGENIDSLIDINEDIGYLADKGTLPLMPPPRMNPAEQPNAETLNNFRTVVSQNYTIKNVDLKDGKIPSSLRTLVIARPTESFGDD